MIYDVKYDVIYNLSYDVIYDVKYDVIYDAVLKNAADIYVILVEYIGIPQLHIKTVTAFDKSQPVIIYLLLSLYKM